MISATRRSLLTLAASAAVLAAGAGAFVFRRHWLRPKLDYQMPEYQGREASLSGVLDAPPFDVCIVGSGPAGAVLGLELARAGVRTVILEAGVVASRMSSDERYALLNAATQSGDQPYSLVTTRAMMPGGSTSLWTGNTPRLLPIDFEHNAYTPEGAGWPVTYAQMDEFYDRAEETLHVTGESNVRYVAPRTRPLPNERRGGKPELKALLRSVDIAAFDTFRSRVESGGPVRIARDVLPEFAKLPDAAFVSGVTARKLIADASDHVTGVLVRDMSGHESVLQARVYVLAAGAVECARRLLLSRSERYPEGLANRFDQVGRTFADHLQRNFTSVLSPNEVVRGAVLPQTVRSYQFYEVSKREGLGGISLTASLRKTEGPDLELRLTGGCELEPAADNRVTLDESQLDPHGDPVAHLHFSASDRDRATDQRMIGHIRRIAGQLNARNIEELPMHWAHHHLGTVRMGTDERTSVVDSNLKLHGVANAFALTSGNFVTSGPANPTLLIVAFAHRLAAHLVSELRAGAFGALSTKGGA